MAAAEFSADAPSGTSDAMAPGVLPEVTVPADAGRTAGGSIPAPPTPG